MYLNIYIYIYSWQKNLNKNIRKACARFKINTGIKKQRQFTHLFTNNTYTKYNLFFFKLTSIKIVHHVFWILRTAATAGRQNECKFRSLWEWLLLENASVVNRRLKIVNKKNVKAFTTAVFFFFIKTIRKTICDVLLQKRQN